MNIVIISYDYSDERRTAYAFVAQLVEQWARQGHNCWVIAPYSVVANSRFHATKEVIQQEGQGTITILRPNFFSASNLKIGGKRISWVMHEWAVNRALKWLPCTPDIIYGHFWERAHEGFQYAKKHGIPLFVATGESDVTSMIGKWKDKKDFCNYVSGVICVSTKNKQESIALGLTDENKCTVIPNAVNTELFHKLDKSSCRHELNISANDFVVVFVGWFNERKGATRVAEAIKQVGGGVKSLFVGGGELEPQCDGILFKGLVPHDKVPLYLGAADCFVLPTLHEGCCNAVVEAMACGLPVISSNLPFNWDILNEDNSIMVDPNNIGEIADAINSLRDDTLKRDILTKGALKSVENLTIDQRAENIINFIKGKINNKNNEKRRIIINGIS